MGRLFSRGQVQPLKPGLIPLDPSQALSAGAGAVGGYTGLYGSNGAIGSRIGKKNSGECPLGLGVFGVLLLMLAWGFPALVIRLWKCSPMPTGRERSSLENFFREHGFRYKELFLWNLLQGSTATAGIMGIFPGSRYILLTPSLLSLLEPEELKAVMAHEMGHVRHLHMVFYLAFMLGLTLLLDLCLRAAPWAFWGSLLLIQNAWIPGETWWKGVS